MEARRKLAESSKNAIKDPEATAATVNASIKTFNALYPALRAAQPGCHLPELHLPLLLGGRGARREQVKVLPGEMLTMFAAMLWRMVGYGLTLGAALMLTGMARTAEACAPKLKHFLIYDDYAVFGVLYQSTQKIPSIKYRDIFIGFTALSFCRWENIFPKNPAETPYTEIGRNLYFERSKKMRMNARLDEMYSERVGQAVCYGKWGKLNNFEFVMNRAMR